VLSCQQRTPVSCVLKYLQVLIENVSGKSGYNFFLVIRSILPLQKNLSISVSWMSCYRRADVEHMFVANDIVHENVNYHYTLRIGPRVCRKSIELSYFVVYLTTLSVAAAIECRCKEDK
jgi:hypothetical protein